MFTGKIVKADEIQPLINHPMNAINLEHNAHVSMDHSLAWGIEAKSVNNEVRAIRLCGADSKSNITLIVEILFPRC